MQYYTTQEAADLLAVGESTIRKWGETGELEIMRVSNDGKRRELLRVSDEEVKRKADELATKRGKKAQTALGALTLALAQMSDAIAGTVSTGIERVLYEQGQATNQMLEAITCAIEAEGKISSLAKENQMLRNIIREKNDEIRQWREIANMGIIERLMGRRKLKKYIDEDTTDFTNSDAENAHSESKNFTNIK
jgi:excisionase family DNA binding protein